MLGELFDPKANLLVNEHFRPHWSQAGTVVFITFRTRDSIPRKVLSLWERQKQAWLANHVNGPVGHWSIVVPTLSKKLQAVFYKTFNRCREDFLDTCHGRCLLKQPQLAQIVADALLHFDNARYQLGDFVVMPNHVHLLAAFLSEDGMKDQCDSWLHFTARGINQEIGERGKFWQQDPFDHLVRSPEQYEYLRRYIADNPQKARLKPGESLYRRYAG